MLKPRSRLGLLLRIVAALALITLVSSAVIWNMGRTRLERALVALRASGGPELPPQMPEVSEGGQKTAAWFAQFKPLEEPPLRSTREIEAYLAEHADSEFAPELRVLADRLRIDDAAVQARGIEDERDKKVFEPLFEEFGGWAPDPRGSLEFERQHEVQDAVEELLAQQIPIENWDPVSRAWSLTRPLAFAELLLRAPELQELSACDPPAARGIERLVPGSLNAVAIVSRALSELLPAAATAGDTRTFVTCAAGTQACGRMFARCWGLTALKGDEFARERACRRIRECLQFLPRGADLRSLEEPIAAWNPRADLLEALRRERAVGNEIFVDFGSGTTEAARVTDGWDFLERESLRLWLNHERAGYLEMLGRAIELAPRQAWEPGAGFDEWVRILDDLRSQRPWQVLRNTITPNLRGEAVLAARLELQRQFTLLCLAVWRDPASAAERVAATSDPFTGKPLSMREEDGVLVFSSPGDGSEPMEARLRLR